jgi:hypothetical protein
MPELIKSHIEDLEQAGVNLESPEELRRQITENQEIIKKATIAVRSKYQDFLTRNSSNQIVNKVATFALATVFEMEGIEMSANYNNYKKAKRSNSNIDGLLNKVRNLLELPEFDFDDQLAIENDKPKVPPSGDTEIAKRTVLNGDSSNLEDHPTEESLSSEPDEADSVSLNNAKEGLVSQITAAERLLESYSNEQVPQTIIYLLSERLTSAKSLASQDFIESKISIERIHTEATSLDSAINQFQEAVNDFLESQGSEIEDLFSSESIEFTSESLEGVGQSIDQHLQNLQALLQEWQSKHEGNVLKWLRADYYMSLAGATNQVSHYIEMLTVKVAELQEIKSSHANLTTMPPQDLAITTELFLHRSHRNSSVETQRKDYVDQVKTAIPFFLSPYGRLYLSQISSFNEFQKSEDKDPQTLEDSLANSQVEFSINLLKSMEDYIPASAISSLGDQLIESIPNISPEQQSKLQAEVDRQYSHADRIGEFSGNWLTLDWALGGGVTKGAALLSKFSYGQKLLAGGTRLAKGTRVGQILSKGHGGVNKFLEYTPKMLQTTGGASKIMNGSKFLLDLSTKVGRVALPIWGLNTLGAPREVQEAIIAVLIVCPSSKGLATALEKNMTKGSGKITPMAAREIEELMAQAVRAVDDNPGDFEEAARKAGLWDKVKEYWSKIKANNFNKRIRNRQLKIDDFADNLKNSSIRKIDAAEEAITKELAQIDNELAVEALATEVVERLLGQKRDLRLIRYKYSQRRFDLSRSGSQPKLAKLNEMINVSHEIIEDALMQLKNIITENYDQILVYIGTIRKELRRFQDYISRLSGELKERAQAQLDDLEARFKKAEQEAREAAGGRAGDSPGSTSASPEELLARRSGERMSQQEIKKLFDSIRNDSSQPNLTRKLLNDENLTPKELIVIDGREFYMGKIIGTPDGQQALVFTSDNGIMKPRVFYKSGSDGGWRATPGMEGGVYSKGKRIHYTQETKPHQSIVDYFERNQSDVIEYSENFIESHFSRFDSSVSYDNEVVVYNDRDLLRGPQKHKPGECFSKFDEFNLQKFIDDCGSLPDGFVPNFQAPKGLPKKLTHTNLTPHTGEKVTLEIFESQLNGRPVEWHMMYDAEGRVWIDRICFADSKVNSYGIPSEVIDTGGLTNKPLEYFSQTTGLEKLSTSIFPRNKIGKYQDITPILDKLEPIKIFRRARGIWRETPSKAA